MLEPFTKLEVVARQPRYKPVLSLLERQAYEAAHRIASANFETRQFPCPGGQRSRKIDVIAQIILEVMGK